MNSLLENSPIRVPRVHTTAGASYGPQTLSELSEVRQAKVGPSVYRGEFQTGSRAAKAWWKHSYPMAAVVISGGALISQAKNLPPSAYVVAVGEGAEKPFSTSKDEIRYRELTRKHFVEGLSVTEQQELDTVEERLDAADEADPHLRLVSAKIGDGYDHLRQELKHVNNVLDRLLAR